MNCSAPWSGRTQWQGLYLLLKVTPIDAYLHSCPIAHDRGRAEEKVKGMRGSKRKIAKRIWFWSIFKVPTDSYPSQLAWSKIYLQVFQNNPLMEVVSNSLLLSCTLCLSLPFFLSFSFKTFLWMQIYAIILSLWDEFRGDRKEMIQNKKDYKKDAYKEGFP